MRPTEEIFQQKTSGIESVRAALLAEARKRKTRTFDQWSQAEMQVVWNATRNFAQKHDLRVPTLAEIARVERASSGHCDYSYKWALYSIELVYETND